MGEEEELPGTRRRGRKQMHNRLIKLEDKGKEVPERRKKAVKAADSTEAVQLAPGIY